MTISMTNGLLSLFCLEMLEAVDMACNLADNFQKHKLSSPALGKLLVSVLKHLKTASIDFSHLQRIVKFLFVFRLLDSQSNLPLIIQRILHSKKDLDPSSKDFMRLLRYLTQLEPRSTAKAMEPLLNDLQLSLEPKLQDLRNDTLFMVLLFFSRHGRESTDKQFIAKMIDEIVVRADSFGKTETLLSIKLLEALKKNLFLADTKLLTVLEKSLVDGIYSDWFGERELLYLCTVMQDSLIVSKEMQTALERRVRGLLPQLELSSLIALRIFLSNLARGKETELTDSIHEEILQMLAGSASAHQISAAEVLDQRKYAKSQQLMSLFDLVYKYSFQARKESRLLIRSLALSLDFFFYEAELEKMAAELRHVKENLIRAIKGITDGLGFKKTLAMMALLRVRDREILQVMKEQFAKVLEQNEHGIAFIAFALQTFEEMEFFIDLDEEKVGQTLQDLLQRRSFEVNPQSFREILRVVCVQLSAKKATTRAMLEKLRVIYKERGNAFGFIERERADILSELVMSPKSLDVELFNEMLRGYAKEKDRFHQREARSARYKRFYQAVARFEVMTGTMPEALKASEELEAIYAKGKMNYEQSLFERRKRDQALDDNSVPYPSLHVLVEGISQKQSLSLKRDAYIINDLVCADYLFVDEQRQKRFALIVLEEREFYLNASEQPLARSLSRVSLLETSKVPHKIVKATDVFNNFEKIKEELSARISEIFTNE
eukprot:TRINITY_DN11640_c0_g1_i1.p1 TRINITY_DN11640_c0_g1~~TRINITY_DN11640_c0_g1_i1.p1  ORF type:complete len:720 (+),score=159.22 TRINITY_DN11640_c0_g1_i1:664-2823(+)